jgi:hypothetical protein
VLANDAPVEAETALRKALDEESAVVSQYPNVPEYQANLGRGHCQVAGLLLKRGLPKEAVTEAETALKIHKAVQQEDPAKSFLGTYLWKDLGVLIRALIDCQRFADADRSAEEFVAITPSDVNSVLDAAGLLVDCANKAFLTPDGTSLVDRFQSRAVKVLANAVRSNILQTSQVLESEQFAPLRDRDDFKKVLEALTQPPRAG